MPKGFKGEDARCMSIVPRQVQTPRTVFSGIGDTKRLRGPWPRPGLFPLVPKASTRRARALKTKLNHWEPSDMAVGEGDGYRLVPLDLNLCRFVSIAQVISMPGVKAKPSRQRPAAAGTV